MSIVALSIVAIELLNPTAFYLCWLGAAIWAALMTGILRPRHGYVDRAIERDERGLLAPQRAADWPHVLLLVRGAAACFAIWVLVLLVYSLIRKPGVDGTGALRWSPADQVLLQLLAPGIAWAVGYAMLAGQKSLWLVGYRVRRMFNGLLSGVLGIFIALPIVYFALQGTLWFWESVHIDHPQKQDLLIAMEETTNTLIRAGAVVGAVVMAPLFEELLFRGFIQSAARRATRSPVLAIAISSVLFALVHPGWTMPPIFVFAILLGLVYERTHNLWATTVMHALFNAFTLITTHA